MPAWRRMFQTIMGKPFCLIAAVAAPEGLSAGSSRKREPRPTVVAQSKGRFGRGFGNPHGAPLHVLLPPPALSKCRHRGLASSGVAVRRSAFERIETVGPHPRTSHGRGLGQEDSPDHHTVGQHIVILVIPLAGWPTERRAF